MTVHPTDGLHVRIRSSKTDQEGQGAVRALSYGRDSLTCPPCALVRWRRILLTYVEDDGGRTSALKELHTRGLSTKHVCRDRGSFGNRGRGRRGIGRSAIGRRCRWGRGAVAVPHHPQDRAAGRESDDR